MREKLLLDYYSNSEAICIKDLKSAALFSKTVYPSYLCVLEAFTHDDLKDYKALLKQLLIGSSSKYGESTSKQFIEFIERIAYSDSEDAKKAYYDEACDLTVKIMHGRLYDPTPWHLFGSDGFFEFENINETAVSSEYESDVSLQLSGLRLVDTAELSWLQIAELRQDPIALAALTDLKLMFFEDYNGKPKSFAVDQIARRIDNYQDTLRKWGMKTVWSSFEMIFSHKNATALAGFGSALFGAPLTRAAVVGTTVTALNLGFHLKKRSDEKQAFIKGDPIRYLVKLNDYSKANVKKI